MARIPNDPYDSSRSSFRDDPLDSRLEREAQVDPELTEGPASNGKVALIAVAIALVLGVVFYGLNNSSVHQASTAPPAQTAQTKPAANPNNQPGVTTGSATSPSTPQQSSPKGPAGTPSANPGQNSTAH
ncbi:MAG: hypothetical protein ACM3OF_06115 [Gemmatimonas sp.]|jgi:hypothetical protein